jgi:hypothetical protein
MAWYNPLDWYTNVDAEVERGRQLDAQIAALNQQRVESGEWTQNDWNNYSRNNDWAETYREDINQGFIEGAAQGWDNLTAPIKSVATGAKNTLTFFVILQYCLAGLALYLVYKFFTKGGSVRQFVP